MTCSVCFSPYASEMMSIRLMCKVTITCQVLFGPSVPWLATTSPPLYFRLLSFPFLATICDYSKAHGCCGCCVHSCRLQSASQFQVIILRDTLQCGPNQLTNGVLVYHLTKQCESVLLSDEKQSCRSYIHGTGFWFCRML